MKRIHLLMSFSFFLCVFTLLFPMIGLTEDQKYGVVDATSLNVREQPSLESAIIGKFANGEEVPIIAQEGEWYKVQFSGKDGYVHGDYLQIYFKAKEVLVDNQTVEKNKETLDNDIASGTGEETTKEITEKPKNEDQITVFINGVELELDTSPILDENRVQVPFRALGEALGIDVKWLGPSRQVQAIDLGTQKNILFTIDKEEVLINNNPVELKPAPRIVHKRTLLPLRFFSETFGADVKWDQEKKQVTIQRQIKEPEAEEQEILFGVVEATALNVRKGPGIEFERIGQLKQGDTFEFVHIEGKWATITFEGSTGYIHTDYVSKVKQGSLKGYVIAIDPGHGGKDPGASDNDVIEKELVLDVGLLVEKKLKEKGATVILTRNDDTYITLGERVILAEEQKAQAFISIHANAAGDENAHGTETYWNKRHSSDDSQELANKIQKHLLEKLGTNDRKIKQANFQVILQSQMPSVLIELGFVTNKEEAEKMLTKEFRESAAEAVVNGIIEYFDEKKEVEARRLKEEDNETDENSDVDREAPQNNDVKEIEDVITDESEEGNVHQDDSNGENMQGSEEGITDQS